MASCYIYFSRFEEWKAPDAANLIKNLILHYEELKVYWKKKKRKIQLLILFIMTNYSNIIEFYQINSNRTN